MVFSVGTEEEEEDRPSKSIGQSGFLSAQSLMNGFLGVQSIRNGTNNKNNKVATFISNPKTVNRAPPYIPDRRLKNLKDDIEFGGCKQKMDLR